MHSDKSILSENELLRKIAGGDEASFKYLFEKYSDKIFSMSMNITHSEYISEEITQDVFCKLWQNRRELEGVCYINSYMRTIASNVACNYMKRLTTEKLILRSIYNESTQTTDSVENIVINKEIYEIMEKAIQNLPPQQRKVYILSRYEGLKQEEIAKKMKISLYTVKEYMKYAVISIRKFVNNKIELSIIIAAQFFIND